MRNGDMWAPGDPWPPQNPYLGGPTERAVRAAAHGAENVRTRARAQMRRLADSGRNYAMRRLPYVVAGSIGGGYAFGRKIVENIQRRVRGQQARSKNAAMARTPARKRSSSTPPRRSPHGRTRSGTPYQRLKRRRASSARPAGKSQRKQMSLTGKNMTRYARTTGRAGLKGRRTTMGFKKKIKRKKLTLPRTVVQKYFLCSAKSLRLHGGSKVGVMSARDKAYSKQGLNVRHPSLLVFNVSATEAHWNPKDFQVGNQFIGYDEPVPGQPDIVRVPFIYERNDLGTGLTARADQDPGQANKSIMYLNGCPESARVRAYDSEDPKVLPWTVPNSVLKSVTINMTISTATVFDQILAIKVIRVSQPIPILPEVLLADAAMTTFVQEMCNRQRETNGQIFQTLWTHSWKSKALKVGSQPYEKRINKTINLGYSRSEYRKVGTATESAQLGSQSMPEFKKAEDGFFNAVFVVISSMMNDEQYTASVQVTGPGGSNTVETVPIRADCGSSITTLQPTGSAAFQDRYEDLPQAPQFRYGGSVTVTHKVNDMTRGVNSAAADAFIALQDRCDKLEKACHLPMDE